MCIWVLIYKVICDKYLKLETEFSFSDFHKGMSASYLLESPGTNNSTINLSTADLNE